MMKFFKKVNFWLLNFLFLGLNADTVLAAKEGGPVISVKLNNPLKSGDIIGVLKGITAFLSKIGVPLLAIFIIIGGFQILTAAGNPEKINTGKKTILYASIGYAIVFSVWGIIAIIEQTLGAKK